MTHDLAEVLANAIVGLAVSWAATWAVLGFSPVQSVGVMGDERTYENAIAVRAVNSVDAMTADWARLPAEVLAKISSRIINEVRGVNRVVYDISSKPPAPISRRRSLRII